MLPAPTVMRLAMQAAIKGNSQSNFFGEYFLVLLP